MRHRITPICSLLAIALVAVPVGVAAQFSSITELRVPREHSEEFVELYAEMANAMETADGVKPVSRNLLAHAWAHDVSFLQINTYETMDDLRADFNRDPGKLGAHRETLSESDAEAFGERVQRYLQLYLEGHTDEMRTWVQDWGFTYDVAGHETHAHVVTRSSYEPTYADVGEFVDLYAELNVPEDPSGSQAIFLQASRHSTGNGSIVDIWTVYESWSDFADFMMDAGGEVDEAKTARLFEIEGKHSDNIFVRVGTLNRAEDGSATFTLANE